MKATPKLWLESLASQAASALANKLKRRRGSLLHGWPRGGVERLEDRTLFTYTFTYGGPLGPQVVDESSGGDSITVINNGAGLLEWSTDGGNTFSTQWGAIPADTLEANPSASLTINLGSDNSAIVVGSSAAPTSSASAVQTALHVSPAAGNTADSLTINDAMSPLGPGSYTLDGQSRTISGPLGDINVQEGAAPFGGGVAIQGSNSGNTFNVSSTYDGSGVAEPVTVTGGIGGDTVNVGSGSSLGAIDAPVIVTDPTGPATLNIDDGSDTTSATATLDNLSGNVSAPYEVTGLSSAPIEYGTGVTALNIDGGTDGGSGVTFAVNNTLSGTTTTLTGGPNQNFFNLANASEPGGLDNLPGAVVVHGGTSFTDVVKLDDSDANFNDNYTVTSTTVSRIVFGGLTYDDNIGTLTLNAENSLGTNGNNSIDINGTADFVTTNINGQGGSDTVSVNSTGSFGALNVTTGTTNGSTVNIVADSEPVNLNLNALTSVNVGSTGGPGTMAGINGAIDIVDSPSLFTLAFHDENDTTGQTWTLDNNDTGTATVALSNGIATTTYQPGDLNSPLTFDGGSGGNTFDVNNTTAFAPTDLNTGTGDDTVNVYAAGDNTLNINGQAGSDNVNLGGLASVGMQDLNGTINVSNSFGFSALTLDDSEDAAGQTGTLADNGTTGTMTGLSPATITYHDTDINGLTILGGSGTNTFNINGTPSDAFLPSLVTTLNSGPGGSDTVNVTATSSTLDLSGAGSNQRDNIGPNGSASDILGAVNVDNAPGSTALSINMSADAVDHALNLSSDGTTGTLHDSLGGLPVDITYNTASLNSLAIDTDGTNNQALNVDFGQGGNPISGLFFNAGTPVSGKQYNLTFSGELPTGPFANETLSANDPADVPATPQFGTIQFDDGTGSPTAYSNVWYTGLGTIADTTPAVNYTFNDFGTDNSFSATSGPVVSGYQTVEFQNTPASGPPTFQTTDIANKSSVTFNTTATVGVTGVVNVPVASDGLVSLAIDTPTNSENSVSFQNTPPGVVTNLVGGTNQDATSVAGTGVAAGTVLFLNGGAGVDTLNYNAGGMNPTVTPGLSPGEVLISIPGAGTVDASGYENLNITNVAPLTILAQPVPSLNTVQGTSLANATVGSFLLPAPLIGSPTAGLPASDFTASINWDDGSPFAGGTITQEALNPSLYYITGTHTFSQNGNYIAFPSVAFKGATYSSSLNGVSVSVTLPALSATPALPAFINVSQGNLAVSVFPLVGTEGSPIPSGPIASFIDGGGAQPVPDYSAVISITNSAGYFLVIPAASISEVGSTAQYTVNAPSISLPEDGTYQVKVSVTAFDGTPQTVSSIGSIVVADAPLTAGAAVILSSNTGANLANAVVGSFSDANPTAPISDFTATIDWGDGSAPSLGTITQPGGVGTAFMVTGSHAYAAPGTFPTQISVTDAGGSKVTLSGSATVTDLPVTGSVSDLSAVAGQSTGTVVLATFSDPNPLATASSVTATLPVGGWGDGTPVAPVTLTVTPIGGTSSSTEFEVTGSHTYAQYGSYSVNVLVTTSGGAVTDLTSGTATVADAPMTPGSGNPVTAVEGAAPVSLTVATFSDANTFATVGDFSAAVTATSSTGQTLTFPSVSIVSQGNGSFAVSAHVSFPDEGTWSISTTVTDTADTQTVIGTTATVADAPLTAGAAVNLATNTGAALTNVPVGSFTDANPTAPLSDFTAVIHWGDGSSSNGTITQPGGVGTGFMVSGSHAYALPGAYSTQVSVADVGGSKVTLTGTNAVTDLPVTGSASDLSAVAGQTTGTVVLATFTDPNPLATVTSVTANLSVGGWGDGTPVAAVPLTVTPIGGTGTSTVFEVTGSHTYAAQGTYSLSISVTTSGGVTTLLTPGTATVADALLTPGAGNPVTATAGAPAATFTVATFNYGNLQANVADFSATVTATSSTGQTVTGSGVTITRQGSGLYAVSAELAFPDTGTWSIVTVVTDLADSQVPIGTTATVSPAPVAITLNTPSLTYTGSPQRATATTSPSGIAVSYTYDGSSSEPTDAGTYSVIASSADPSYAGTAHGSMTISRATPTIDITTPTASYDGTAHGATAVVVGVNGGASPGSAALTYFAGVGTGGTQLSDAPIDAGTYTVLASYAGSGDYVPLTQTATFTIAAHSPPTAAAITGTGLPGVDITLAPAGSSTDGGTLSYSVLTQPAFGSVSVVMVSGTQQFLYQPGTGAFTSDSFTYQVTDSFGGTATATATVNYAGVGLVSSSLNAGAKDLVVIEASGNHSVTFANAGSAKKLKVTVDGVAQGTYAVTGRVFGFAPSGNDLFNASAISRSVWLYGGAGNNTFVGGSADDVLVGGAGNDSLNGGAGRNVLIGGGGTNTLAGAKGTNILVAGTTLYDAPSFANQAALLRILTTWQTSKTTPNLPGGVGAGFGGAGTPALDSSTITSVDTGDELIGNTHSWFFGDFTFNGGTDVFNDGRHIKPNHYLTPLKGERVTEI